jgi:P-type Cu+ transporter
MTSDPVCGMQIDEKKAEGEIEYEGHTYFFCASGCRKKSAQDPKRYVRDPQRDPNAGRGK